MMLQNLGFDPSIMIPQSGGMFGGGGNDRLRNALLAAAAGFMARRSPTVANNIFSGMQDAQLLKEKIAEAQQERAQQFQDERLAHQQDRQFDIANPLPQQSPAPGSMDALRAEYLDPSTPPERKRQLEPIVLAPQMQYVPGVGLVSVPRTGSAPSVPTAPVGNLKPYGGPASGAPGGFL